MIDQKSVDSLRTALVLAGESVTRAWAEREAAHVACEHLDTVDAHERIVAANAAVDAACNRHMALRRELMVAECDVTGEATR